MDWRKKLSADPDEIKAMSIDSMAAARLMRGMGGSVKDIGRMCKRFGVPYDENGSPFTRAVALFREVYPRETAFIDFVDVRCGRTAFSLNDEMLDDTRTGIVFYRINGTPEMVAFVKGLELSSSPLGAVVIKPGIKYVQKRNGMELWVQDPVLLIQSFSTIEEG